MPIQTRVETITPAIASKYLERNAPTNRKPKDSKIGLYAREMAAGRWQMTGEAIKFSDDGTLIDGQNRLRAIVRADVPVSMLVVRGLPAEAMPVLDSGSSRTAADALTISGLVQGTDAKNVAATVRGHLAWVNGDIPHAGVKDGGRTAATRLELQDHLEAHPDLIQATHDAVKIYRVLKLPIGSIATARYVFNQIDKVDSDAFFETIISGATNGVGDPLYTLQKRVVSDKSVGTGRISFALGLFYLFRTWNAVRKGESIQKFQVGSALTGWKQIPTPK